MSDGKVRGICPRTFFLSKKKFDRLDRYLSHGSVKYDKIRLWIMGFICGRLTVSDALRSL